MLSKRLELVASFVPKSKKVFDVGCDHGYLAIYLKKYNNNTVVASDITSKCVLKAKSNIAKENLDIEVIETDGLNDLNIRRNDVIVISGMGTHTILDILSKNISKLSNTLIIQSNNNLELLRKSICKMGYFIVKEEAILDNKIYYVIIKFVKGKSKYNKYDYIIGTSLLTNKEYYIYLFHQYDFIYNSLPKKYLIKKYKLNKIISKIKEKI